MFCCCCLFALYFETESLLAEAGPVLPMYLRKVLNLDSSIRVQGVYSAPLINLMIFPIPPTYEIRLL